MPTCSNRCEVFINNFEITLCDDNNTGTITSDDSYRLDFNISAVYPHQDSLYDLILGDNILGTFSYDEDHTLTILANGNSENLYFRDSGTEFCEAFEIVSLAFCSEPVLITDDVVIPNIFSPNDDNINDIWTVNTFNESQIIDCNIYDRWGNLIYTSKNGKIPSWDGWFNGKIVNPGVYIFKLIYIDANQETVVKYGDITVI